MSTPDKRARDAIDRIREDAVDGELRDEIENMSDEEIAKALAAAGTSAEAARAQVREVLGSPPKEQAVAEVVPLAPRRRRLARFSVWLVAAALAVGGGAVAVVATRDEGPGDTRVAAPACLVTVESGMTVEGTVVRRGEGYELDLVTPLCGRESGLVPTVTLTGAVDPAPLVGRRVKLEGRPLDTDGGVITFEARRTL